MDELDVRIIHDHLSVADGLCKVTAATSRAVCSSEINIVIDGDVIRKVLFTGGCHGNPIYPPAKRCLAQHGVPFDSSKTARTITKADYDRFDRIICLDSSNQRRLSRIIGEDREGTVSLMMSWCGNGRDVADPWYTGYFERTYQDILAGCGAMIELDLHHQ